MWGQLATGSFVDFMNPVLINTVFPPCINELSPIVNLWCGMHHSFFLSRSGTLFASGRNENGELATVTIETRVPAPIESQYSTRGSIKKIVAGENFSMLLTST